MKYHVEQYVNPVKENWDDNCMNALDISSFEAFRNAGIARMQSILFTKENWEKEQQKNSKLYEVDFKK